MMMHVDDDDDDNDDDDNEGDAGAVSHIFIKHFNHHHHRGRPLATIFPGSYFCLGFCKGELSHSLETHFLKYFPNRSILKKDF